MSTDGLLGLLWGRCSQALSVQAWPSEEHRIFYSPGSLLCSGWSRLAGVENRSWLGLSQLPGSRGGRELSFPLLERGICQKGGGKKSSVGEWRWGQVTLRPMAVDKPKVEASNATKG